MSVCLTILQQFNYVLWEYIMYEHELVPYLELELKTSFYFGHNQVQIIYIHFNWTKPRINANKIERQRQRENGNLTWNGWGKIHFISMSSMQTCEIQFWHCQYSVCAVGTIRVRFSDLMPHEYREPAKFL